MDKTLSSIPNTNNGSGADPHLRIGLSMLTVVDLPVWSNGPKGTSEEMMPAIAAAGYEAVQTYHPVAARDAGLVPTALRRIDKPDDAKRIASADRDLGFDCTTVHVGTGFESADEIRALISAVIDASYASNYPIFVETHRATVTQDMKRTLDMVSDCPEVRFNGDFSHWYTGAEMTYGDVDAKIARLQPVLTRTRFLHGRVSNPGAIQIRCGQDDAQKHVDFFRNVWTKSFSGFLSSAKPGDYFCFYPELLPASFFYARLVPGKNGAPEEECDRWEEAGLLVSIARECWAKALADRELGL